MSKNNTDDNTSGTVHVRAVAPGHPEHPCSARINRSGALRGEEPETTVEPTTIETITDEQIKALRTEAAAHTDLKQARLCAIALGHPILVRPTDDEVAAARLACVEAIREAELA